MSETEISQTPEGRPPEGHPPESPPPEAASTSARIRPRPTWRARRRAPTGAAQAQDRRHPSRARRPARRAAPVPVPSKAEPAPVVPLARPEATAPMEDDTDVASPAGPSGPDNDGAEPPERRPRSRRRSGRDRRSKQVGRYLVCVHVQPHMTQIAMLEGRSLVEHYVSRAADDTNQIDGNVYRGRVQNVLPGMEAAFVDIGIPKNAVLVPGRRALRQGGHRGRGVPAAPDRGRAQGGAGRSCARSRRTPSGPRGPA